MTAPLRWRLSASRRTRTPITCSTSQRPRRSSRKPGARPTLSWSTCTLVPRGARPTTSRGRRNITWAKTGATPRLSRMQRSTMGPTLLLPVVPHVLRGMEFYKGDLIDYSMGNFAGYGNFATGGDLSLSGILRVTLGGRGGFVKASFTSITLNGNGQPSVDPSGRGSSFRSPIIAGGFWRLCGSVEPGGSHLPACVGLGSCPPVQRDLSQPPRLDFVDEATDVPFWAQKGWPRPGRGRHLSPLEKPPARSWAADRCRPGSVPSLHRR